MSCQLSDADRHAIDLLMNRRQGNGNGDGNGGSSEPFAAFNAPAVHQRLNHVESFLKVLELLPAVDPPKDLADRTLQRIDQAVHAGAMNASQGSAARPSL